jgi:hypothetical protein
MLLENCYSFNFMRVNNVHFALLPLCSLSVLSEIFLKISSGTLNVGLVDSLKQTLNMGCLDL